MLSFSYAFLRSVRFKVRATRMLNVLLNSVSFGSSSDSEAHGTDLHGRIAFAI